jgi:hypothetical protein
MAQIATHRPDDFARHHAWENLVVPVRPGQNKRATEPRRSGVGRSDLLEHLPRPGHRPNKIAPVRPFRPIGGVNTWLAAEPVNLDPAVVGKSRKAGRLGGGMGLDASVAREGGFGLVRLWQTMIGVGTDRNPIGLEKRLNFFKLPRVVRRDDEVFPVEPAVHFVAANWAATNSATPFSARSRRLFIWARE